MWDKYRGPYEQQGIDFDGFCKIQAQRPKYSTLWWQYKEAGTYPDIIELEKPFSNEIQFTAPKVTKKSTIHLILEAKDDGALPLTAFERIIVTVLP
jgi:hypothetical protein